MEAVLLSEDGPVHHGVRLLAHHLIGAHDAATVLARKVLARAHHHWTLWQLLLGHDGGPLHIGLHLHREVGTNLLAKVGIELSLVLWVHHVWHAKKLLLLLLLLLWNYWYWLHHSRARCNARTSDG